MYKVMIVDDEMVVRIGLKVMLHKEDSPFQLVGVADDGVAALAMQEKVQPDIIITDLKMTKMDGLTLIKKLNERSFQGKIIVLSNHGDYELVREAMTLGAVDYLLKVTLKTDELFDTLRKASEQLTVERKERAENSRILAEKRRLQKNIFFNDLIQDHGTGSAQGIEVQAQKIGIHVHNRTCILYYIAIEQYERSVANGKIKDELLLSFSILNVVSEVFNNVAGAEFVKLSYADYITILPVSAELASRQSQYQMARKLEKTLRLYLNLQVRIVMSNYFSGLQHFKRTFETCKQAIMGMKIYADPPSVVDVNDVALFHKEIKAVIEFIEQNITQKLSLNVIAEHVNMNESYLSRLFKKEVGKNMTHYIQELRMKRALALLQDTDLQVKEIAASVGIDDPFYFSRIFKNIYGKSPTQFKNKTT